MVESSDEKLKILVVDDESLIRDLIKMRVKWEENGMTIIGEAASAHEALAMTDELMPDIIFTDICMPHMDGIELSRLIVEKYPHIKIVIITGYDEFEYARNGIKLGIADFLLKPIKASDILDVTERLKGVIAKERSHEQAYNDLKRELEVNYPFLKEKFLNEMLTGALSTHNISERLCYFNISLNWEKGVFWVAVAEYSSAYCKCSEEDKILLEMKCKDKTVQFFGKDQWVTIFSDNRRRVVILSGNEELNLVEMCEMLKTNIINSLKCYASFGIGSKQCSLVNLHRSYQEACDALDYIAVVGKNQVVCYEDMCNTESQRYMSDFKKIEKLYFYVTVGAIAQAHSTLESIFDASCYGGPDIMVQFQLAALDVISVLRRIVLEQKIKTLQTFLEENMASILSLNNLPELTDKLRHVTAILSEAINSKNQTKAGNLIRQVKQYLDEHMGDSELSLSSVAGDFFVSSGHLGRLMKQETDQTFVEYLTNIRMERAEKLLRESDLMSYQVGEMVGICNPHYFSVLFKKHTGMSVNNFRKI